MEQYPINLDLKNKKVLIVGGGKVASRKLKRLLTTAAEIKLVSPCLTDSIAAQKDKIDYYQRKFVIKDLTDCFLVIVATNKPEVNKRIGQLALERNILANIVDNPELSTFTLPGLVKRGDLLLTVATGGNLPALSKQIVQKLASEFGNEYEDFLVLMSEIRPVVLNKIEDEQKRRTIFRKLADDKIINLLGKQKEKGLAEIKKILPQSILKELNLSNKIKERKQ
ncbi:precorrin-2 dehydrogenase/sirohydrochlorin ferrochelatase family protein [Halanaerobacter jeridensis]|uniref:precorrin-2 dehydrogenase n=1 Tax=Halanaerobacter jeridensis TaxID=706427 RepID=A0A939BPP0_9FIRM|nr:bifunctional precorrin-2 dehydrogenase/sirohydrochlorin ferrochelatase [Halanaerobacter jeridensis]MBM7557108.1 precorrin-2 dehydrogenase/sirohydrochlorin ferrochelatase [Halanaerobacter jeridensis]